MATGARGVQTSQGIRKRKKRGSPAKQGSRQEEPKRAQPNPAAKAKHKSRARTNGDPGQGREKTQKAKKMTYAQGGTCGIRTREKGKHPQPPNSVSYKYPRRKYRTARGAKGRGPARKRQSNHRHTSNACKYTKR